jgi:hypothetical protein
MVMQKWGGHDSTFRKASSDETLKQEIYDKLVNLRIGPSLQGNKERLNSKPEASRNRRETWPV